MALSFTSERFGGGARGAKGEPGSSITFKATVASVSALNALTGMSEDDARVVEENGHVYIYNGSSWIDGGQFLGPAGPTGPAGPAGSIDLLTDVVITSPLEYQILEYNGTNWVNANAPSSVFVRNAESTTLTTGTVVYLFGATGDHATVKRADNDSDTTSSKTVGVVSASIAASENGVVVTQGYVDGIDLSVGYASGDVLWLGEDGGFTKTKPSAPEHLVFIGVVVRATNNGIIYVSTQNGYELDELHDVAINPGTLATGDVIRYNASTALWENSQNNLNGITDVVITGTPTNKQLLVYDSATSQWVNADPITSTGIAYKSGVPASPTATGVVGQLAIDGANGVLYVCTSTNNWQKVSLNAANFTNVGGFA